jgi:2-methylaconitate cis-trans-isomerase PrpF
MEATTVVAIYAAIVATAAVLVQLAVWRSTRTQVQLRVTPGTGPVEVNLMAGAASSRKTRMWSSSRSQTGAVTR